MSGFITVLSKSLRQSPRPSRRECIPPQNVAQFVAAFSVAQHRISSTSYHPPQGSVNQEVGRRSSSPFGLASEG
jgi:hypothetical protein